MESDLSSPPFRERTGHRAFSGKEPRRHKRPKNAIKVFDLYDALELKQSHFEEKSRRFFWPSSISPRVAQRESLHCPRDGDETIPALFFHFWALISFLPALKRRQFVFHQPR
jgi:hypothetical protein